jgi:hypothetical protein
MPRLPNAGLVIIDERKITRYLLAADHPVGAPKALFSRQFGYRLVTWTEFRDALCAHVLSGELVSTREFEFGMKYIVQGPIITPSGQRPIIRSVWVVGAGETKPRLVTAYPLATR